MSVDNGNFTTLKNNIFESRNNTVFQQTTQNSIIKVHIDPILSKPKEKRNKSQKSVEIKSMNSKKMPVKIINKDKKPIKTQN